MTIKYIFKSGRKIRLNSSDDYPEEFFYGYNYFKNKGIKVDLIEEKDLYLFDKRGIEDYFNKLLNLLIDFPFYHFIKLIRKNNLTLLNDSNIILVSTNSMGLALGLLKNLGFIKKPVLFLAMGIIPIGANFLKVKFYKFLLKNMHVICLSKKEKNYLVKKLDNRNIFYLPFGIDNKYWKPNLKDTKIKNYVFAIGNDYSRDWITLINSWDIDFPKLKIFTSSSIETNKENVEIIRAEWGKQIFTDNEIKNLYLQASFVIIPLKDTIQPSGQSCCLQAMACGKPVIMSKIKGLWDGKSLENGKNIIFVQPGSTISLKKAIKKLIYNKTLQKKLSLNGKLLVDKKFNNTLMSDSLLSTIETILKK